MMLFYFTLTNDRSSPIHPNRLTSGVIDAADLESATSQLDEALRTKMPKTGARADAYSLMSLDQALEEKPSDMFGIIAISMANR